MEHIQELINKCDKIEKAIEINVITHDLFIYLNKSILSGEYLQESYIKKVEDLASILGFLDTDKLLIDKQSTDDCETIEVTPNSSEQDGVDQEASSNELEQDGNSSINKTPVEYPELFYRYISTIEEVTNHYNNDDRDIDVYATFEENEPYKFIDENLKFLLEISFKLIKFDHFPELSNKRLSNLLSIYHTISKKSTDGKNDEYHTVLRGLLTKCSILIYKIAQRLKLIDKKYCINNEPKYLSDIIDNQDSDIYKTFVRKNRELYSDSMSHSKNELSFYCWYSNANYFRSNNDLASLDELIEKAKRQYTENDSRQSDTAVDDHIVMYIQNCIISSRLDTQSNLSVEEIEKLVESTKRIELKNSIRNYHAYKKILQYISKNIDYIVDKDFDKHSAWLELYNTTLKRIKRSYRWCVENNFFPILLPREECIIKSNNQTEKLYIASSYSHIINYDELKDLISQFEHNAATLTTMFLQKKHSLGIKKQLLKQEDDFKQERRRNFEYLGIFLGLTTFLFGSTTRIFDSSIHLDGYKMIAPMCYMGIVITLFIALLLIAVDYKQKASERMKWLIGFIIVASIILSIFRF